MHEPRRWNEFFLCLRANYRGLQAASRRGELESDGLTGSTLRQDGKICFANDSDLGIAANRGCIRHQRNRKSVARDLDCAGAASFGGERAEGVREGRPLEFVAGTVRRGRDSVFAFGQSAHRGFIEQAFLCSRGDVNDPAIVAWHEIGGSVKSWRRVRPRPRSKPNGISAFQHASFISSKVPREISGSASEEGGDVDSPVAGQVEKPATGDLFDDDLVPGPSEAGRP